MAKKSAGTARKASAKTMTNKNLEAQINAIEEEAQLRRKQAEEEFKAKIKEVIQFKKDEVSAAKAALRDAQKNLAHLENELISLQKKAGLKAGTTRRAGAGRKPRVSNDTKKAQVEAVLAKHPKIEFSKLKAVLLDIIDTESGHPFFSPPDFASSKVFAKKYLPKGFKVEGVRRDAKIVPSK